MAESYDVVDAIRKVLVANLPALERDLGAHVMVSGTRGESFSVFVEDAEATGRQRFRVDVARRGSGADGGKR